MRATILPAAAVVAALLAGCAGVTPDDTAADLPACVAEVPQIDFADGVVGYRASSIDYALPWDGTPRTIGLNVWYPTDAPSDTGAQYIGMWNDPDSRVDSPVRADDCRRPLVLYSHGSQAWGGNNYALMQQFVRNGWIAAAPDHTGNTLADNLDDKPVVFPLMRAADIVATLDTLAALPADDPLYGHIDTSRVVVLGHSYGGQTNWLLSGVGLNADGAAAACADGACTDDELRALAQPAGDARIVGVGPMAGSADATLVDDTTWADVDVPILYQTGSADNDGTEPYARASAADVRWVELDGGCHESFTSTDLPCATLDKDVAAPIVATYALAFGWSTVLGSTAPEVTGVLDGSVGVSDVATFQHSR